jgi:hypothetical protein
LWFFSLLGSRRAAFPTSAKVNDPHCSGESFLPELAGSMLAGGQKLRGEPRGIRQSGSIQRQLELELFVRSIGMHTRPGIHEDRCEVARFFCILPRPVTFVNDLSSDGQPATFTLIGATGQGLPRNWARLAVAVHLLLLQSEEM